MLVIETRQGTSFKLNTMCICQLQGKKKECISHIDILIYYIMSKKNLIYF